jgi:hypothetical protein
VRQLTGTAPRAATCGSWLLELGNIAIVDRDEAIVARVLRGGIGRE